MRPPDRLLSINQGDLVVPRTDGGGECRAGGLVSSLVSSLVMALDAR